MTADKPLTEHERDLLGILQWHGGWMSRRAIALVLQQERLSFRTVRVLNKLTAWGMIEVRHSSNEGHKPHFEYRAITPPATNGG